MFLKLSNNVTRNRKKEVKASKIFWSYQFIYRKKMEQEAWRRRHQTEDQNGTDAQAWMYLELALSGRRKNESG